MIRSRLIYIVEEVIYAAQLCRPPASGIAEEDGPRDRLVCKVVVVLLYLSDDVLLKDRVNSILSPAFRIKFNTIAHIKTLFLPLTRNPGRETRHI